MRPTLAAGPGPRSKRQRGDGQDARQPDLRQDRFAGPHPGHPLRLHARLRWSRAQQL